MKIKIQNFKATTRNNEREMINLNFISVFDDFFFFYLPLSMVKHKK